MNLDDVRAALQLLQKGLTSTSTDLRDNLDIYNQTDDVEPEAEKTNDRYARIMFPFLREAEDEVQSLQDKMRLAGSVFQEVLKLYQEDHRSQTTGEFFSIFKTLVVSYEVCDLLYNSERSDICCSAS